MSDRVIACDDSKCKCDHGKCTTNTWFFLDEKNDYQRYVDSSGLSKAELGDLYKGRRLCTTCIKDRNDDEKEVNWKDGI